MSCYISFSCKKCNLKPIFLLLKQVFCCEACIREFTDRSSLWLHMLYTHKDAAATACGLCLKVCGDLSSLTSHIQTSHSTSQLLVEKRRYRYTSSIKKKEFTKTSKPLFYSLDLFQLLNMYETT